MFWGLGSLRTFDLRLSSVKRKGGKEGLVMRKRMGC